MPAGVAVPASGSLLTNEAQGAGETECARGAVRWCDRDVVLRAVAQNGTGLEYAVAKLKGDREVVLAAVTKHGNALRFAATEAQGDREIVLAAVTKHGTALVYAAAELQGDREVVLAAVAQNRIALENAAAELRADSVLLQMSSLNPRLSAFLLVAQLRLYLAYACHERVGGESLLRCLPLEVVELIGQQMTVHVVLYGLVCRPALPSAGGVLPE